jgi:hypothetical protein
MIKFIVMHDPMTKFIVILVAKTRAGGKGQCLRDYTRATVARAGLRLIVG